MTDNSRAAFSAWTAEHASEERSATTICYNKDFLKTEAWRDGKVYIVPYDGLYFFALSFVRDQQDPPAGRNEEEWPWESMEKEARVAAKSNQGDWRDCYDGSLCRGSGDDSSIRLYVNETVKAIAYAGENTGRQTGAVSITLLLKEGDRVTTKDWIPGFRPKGDELKGAGEKNWIRRFRNCTFTGHALEGPPQ